MSDTAKKAIAKIRAGSVRYPADHQPGMRVPPGGSSCSSCRYVSDDAMHCGNEYFQRWHGSNELPAPANEYCSDWYEPQEGLVQA